MGDREPIVVIGHAVSIAMKVSRIANLVMLTPGGAIPGDMLERHFARFDLVMDPTGA